MAASGIGRDPRRLSTRAGPERPDLEPRGHQHGVLPHLRGHVVRVRPRRGGRDDPGGLRPLQRLGGGPSETPQGVQRADRLHQTLGPAARHTGERDPHVARRQGQAAPEARPVVREL